ncbi:MAG TPA: ABC transporter ATP-binding protein [bacterium]|nr:ABC transporter ATP-binding protein [bacterium]HQG44131.1 ABC transporter ATP-binding protein [bacterium]HQI48717.1 ABC transporter ATP-binding protein [bacterium]HQJ63698.1 ABC transporter ATP-binding protein [bacterium]
MSEILLHTENIHKSYPMGRSSQLEVLKGIDLEIVEGEIITIIGPSGVGKSTLLHLIGGLDRPSQGRVLIDGNDISGFDDTRLAQFRNRTIGFIFQFHHLLPEFTALENVILPGLVSRQERRALQKRALALLERVGLSGRVQHRPKELSGGEQQRVAVARALINSPRLLLADEPSGNLDTESAQKLHDMLWELSRQLRQTLVVVTHNRDLADRSDRIIELYNGRIKTITCNHSNKIV